MKSTLRTHLSLDFVLRLSAGKEAFLRHLKVIGTNTIVRMNTVGVHDATSETLLAATRVDIATAFFCPDSLRKGRLLNSLPLAQTIRVGVKRVFVSCQSQPPMRLSAYSV